MNIPPSLLLHREEIESMHAKVLSLASTHAELAVYSACTNSYDCPVDTRLFDTGQVDYFFFSDNKDTVPTGWNWVPIAFEHRDPRRTAKIFKVLPHLFFGRYKSTVWIDSNRRISRSLLDMAGWVDFANPIGLFRHNKRSDVAREAEECIKWGKDSSDVISEQVSRYDDRYDVAMLGLFSGCFLVRFQKSEALVDAMNWWWSEIDKWSVRDQLSLPAALFVSGVEPKIIPGNSNDNKYFDTDVHSKVRVYQKGLVIQARVIMSRFAIWLGARVRSARRT